MKCAATAGKAARKLQDAPAGPRAGRIPASPAKCAQGPLRRCVLLQMLLPDQLTHAFLPNQPRFWWFNITNPVGMMKAGRVRALAIAAEQRLSQHADVPTLAEVGFPGMPAAQWVAALAPSAVPADVVETLRKAFVAAMSVPEMQAAFARGGMVVPRRSALADAKGWLRDEMASWRRDVQDTGIVVEE